MMHWLLTVPPWLVATPAAILVAIGGWWLYCRGADAGREQGKNIGFAIGYEAGKKWQRDLMKGAAR